MGKRSAPGASDRHPHGPRPRRGLGSPKATRARAAPGGGAPELNRGPYGRPGGQWHVEARRASKESCRAGLKSRRVAIGQLDWN